MTRRPLRASWQALATLVGVPRGYFIPYRHAATATATGPGGADRYAAIGAWLEHHRMAFAALLTRAQDHADALCAMTGPAPHPRWTQDWFPRLDGLAAYVLVRSIGPRRIIEIGSGHSTRFLARAAADGGGATRITCIDPSPRAAIADLGVEHRQSLLQAVDHRLFAELAPGDILFVDSSHILMPGSDVDIVLGAILPRLAQGVIIHFHDIFLPDAYPDDWGWRGYNEQSALAAVLSGGGFRPLFASHYVATRMAADVAASIAARIPLPDGARESSLWLEKHAPALGR